ncbi:hypothetical protein IQ06DRAFT_75602 [Phaeosphaeriaceae sp. SRC1lsM3a]|nr:hypothetical protein IQ06DRAFT_75602 [Stagonospora sp. SRC1lsM3a]
MDADSKLGGNGYLGWTQSKQHGSTQDGSKHRDGVHVLDLVPSNTVLCNCSLLVACCQIVYSRLPTALGCTLEQTLCLTASMLYRPSQPTSNRSTMVWPDQEHGDVSVCIVRSWSIRRDHFRCEFLQSPEVRQAVDGRLLRCGVVIGCVHREGRQRLRR